MIKNLSICVVTKNNQDTLDECIISINDICSDIIFTDMGSNDDTLEIIHRYKYKILPQVSKNKKDNKNNLIKYSKNDWILFIEPNEKIINGKNEIDKLIDEKQSVYSILLLQNNILSKSIRLFNKNLNISFENPIYENIYHESIKTSIVLKQIADIEIEDEFEILTKWKESEKLKSYPLYYESCFFIKNKKYEEFLKASKRYLFFEENTDLPSYLMIKYYSALIYFYIKKDFSNSVSNIIFCLEKNPTMAEFWCLLGDINFELKKYKKAFYIYENAIILGKLRVNDDDLPVDIIKYKDYPEKMKINCKEALDKI